MVLKLNQLELRLRRLVRCNITPQVLLFSVPHLLLGVAWLLGASFCPFAREQSKPGWLCSASGCAYPIFLALLSECPIGEITLTCSCSVDKTKGSHCKTTGEHSLYNAQAQNNASLALKQDLPLKSLSASNSSSISYIRYN